MSQFTPESEAEAEERASYLAKECRRRLDTVKAMIDELAAEVDPLVGSYRQLTALAHRLGKPAVPDVREDITKRLYVRLDALRPFIPFEHDPETK